MGTFLSTPITSKHVESGHDLDSNDAASSEEDDVPVSWGVVDMQGWRKSMEDAHVARTDVRVFHHCDDNPNNDSSTTSTANSTKRTKKRRAKVFAVFDGHGGAEVARFCQMNLVDVLVAQEGWKNLANAVDATCAAAATAATAATDDDEGDETNDNEESNTVANHIGSALVHSFHALDRLILDPSKRAEIERWRSERPPVYVHGSAAASDDTSNGHVTADSSVNHDKEDTDATMKSNSNLQELHLIGDLDRHEDYDSDDSSCVAGEITAMGGEGGHAVPSDNVVDDLKEIDERGGRHVGMNGESTAATTSTGEVDKSEAGNDDQGNNALDTLDNDAGDGIVNDDSDDEKEDTTTTKGIMGGADPYSLFSKLLHMNHSSNDQDDDDDYEEELVVENVAQENSNEEERATVLIPTLDQLMNPPTGIIAPNASIPTKIMNGRKVCNLPDLPVHAGCTSVVAVILGNDLVVANAGDSRAIMCRKGGLTEPLSFDHKPLQVSGWCCCCCFGAASVAIHYRSLTMNSSPHTFHFKET